MDRVTLDARQVAALRLQTLGLLRVPRGTASRPVDVARHLLAAQAQDFAASRWALGSRTDCVEADIFAAYDRGEIVRSWPMRGTVHVTAAEDLPWLLELTGVRALAPAALRRRWANLGLDRATLERARRVAEERLRGGGRASRAELGDAFTGAGLDVAGQRMYHTVWYLAQTGTLVHGPTRDGEHQLVLLDEWITAPRRLGREDALGELVVRYLRSHGPATIDDLGWWSGLTRGDLRAGIESAGRDIVTVRHAETDAPLLLCAETLERHDSDPARVRRSTYALAPFDEHLLGYRRRDDVVDPAHARAVDPMRNGVFRATVVHGGRVVAIWRVTRRARGVVVSLVPLTKLTKAQVAGASRAIRDWAVFRSVDLIDVDLAPPGTK
jgi:hypothetical protein